MGIEFLKNTKKTIKKTINNHAISLASANLFSATPDEKPCVYLGTLMPGSQLALGESLIAQVRKSDQVMLRRGNDDVGVLDCPPVQTVSAIRLAGGVAGAVVQKIHRISGKVDIKFAEQYE